MPENAPNNGSDADGISREIEKRRQRAVELDVPQLIAGLYHDHIKFYPEWMKNQRSRVWIYPSITEAVQLDERRIKLIMGGINYVFSFTEKWIGGRRSIMYLISKILLRVTGYIISRI